MSFLETHYRNKLNPVRMFCLERIGHLLVLLCIYVVHLRAKCIYSDEKCGTAFVDS